MTSDSSKLLGSVEPNWLALKEWGSRMAPARPPVSACMKSPYQMDERMNATIAHKGSLPPLAMAQVWLARSFCNLLPGGPSKGLYHISEIFEGAATANYHTRQACTSERKEQQTGTPDTQKWECFSWERARSDIGIFKLKPVVLP